MSQELDAFEYTPLADVDPSFSAVPQDVYTMEVVEGKKRTWTYKQDTKTAKAGDPGASYAIDFLIVDHDKFAGRRIFASYFGNDFTARGFRRLMDASGHAQQPGQSVTEWLESFKGLSPRIKIKTLVELKDDRKKVGADGQPEKVNEVNMKEVIPA